VRATDSKEYREKKKGRWRGRHRERERERENCVTHSVELPERNNSYPKNKKIITKKMP